jgi:hypothetical protein
MRKLGLFEQLVEHPEHEREHQLQRRREDRHDPSQRLGDDLGRGLHVRGSRV